MNKNKLLAYIATELKELHEWRHSYDSDHYRGYFAGAINHLSALEARIERGEFE